MPTIRLLVTDSGRLPLGVSGRSAPDCCSVSRILSKETMSSGPYDGRVVHSDHSAAIKWLGLI